MTERIGRAIFAFTIAAIGIESILCAQASTLFFRKERVLPIIPWPPAIPTLAILLGIVLVVCGILMLRTRTVRLGAVSFAIVFALSALVFDLPRYVGHLGNVPLRSLVLEPLTMAALAWMLPAAKLPNDWIMTLAQYCVALSLVVYGVDHFLATPFIVSVMPPWMPFKLFWVLFFGIALIVAGVGFATNALRGWAAAGTALTFALFVLTLHIPRTLGAYGIPGAIQDPDEWSSLFIPLAFCGGFLALASLQRAQISTTVLRQRSSNG